MISNKNLEAVLDNLSVDATGEYFFMIILFYLAFNKNCINWLIFFHFRIISFDTNSRKIYNSNGSWIFKGECFQKCPHGHKKRKHLDGNKKME